MGMWTHVVRATSAAHSGESVTSAAMRVLTRCMSVAAICDRAAKAAQTVTVASQVAAATSASGIAAGESGTATVRSTAATLAPGGHRTNRTSFFDNGRQPTAEELAIAESVRAASRSSATYLATMEPVQAQITAAHAQLVAAFSKEMADTDGEMLPNMVCWMPWSSFPRTPLGAT